MHSRLITAACVVLFGATDHAGSAGSAVEPSAAQYAVTRPALTSVATTTVAEAPVTLQKAADPATIPRVLLVTLDGVRWQDVARGLDSADTSPWFPCLHAQIAKWGTALGLGRTQCGTVAATSPSFVSLPGYREIFSGHPSSCGSNTCPPLRRPTLFDALHSSGALPSELFSITSWDGITGALSLHPEDTLTVLVGARARASALEASDPILGKLLDEGARRAGYPGSGRNYRPDANTIQIGLRVWTQRRPRLLHLGLGDADEYGHRMDRTRYHLALKRSDRLFCELGDELARDAESSTTPSPSLVLVTADHGRASNFRDHGAAYPESARSFVVAFGDALSPRASPCVKENYALADIAPTLAHFLNVPMERGRDGVVGSAMQALVGEVPTEESPARENEIASIAH